MEFAPEMMQDLGLWALANFYLSQPLWWHDPEPLARAHVSYPAPPSAVPFPCTNWGKNGGKRNKLGSKRPRRHLYSLWNCSGPLPAPLPEPPGLAGQGLLAGSIALLPPFPASALQKRKSSPRTYQEALKLVEELQEVFESGEEPAPGTAGLSDEVPVIKALLAEAASKQRSPEKLQLRGKKGAKKVPKRKAVAQPVLE